MKERMSKNIIRGKMGLEKIEFTGVCLEMATSY